MNFSCEKIPLALGVARSSINSGCHARSAREMVPLKEKSFLEWWERMK